jgi:hypothetical protein
MSSSLRFLPLLYGPVFGFVLFVPTSAQADGGSICFQGDTTSFHVTVFTSPPVLSAGTVDLTVLVQDRTRLDPLLDATVTFDLIAESTGTRPVAAWTPPACASTTRFSLAGIPAKLYHGENRLLYGAYVQIPCSGMWKLKITIERASAIENVSTLLPVNPPVPPALAYWHLLILPPLCILGFVVNRSARR